MDDDPVAVDDAPGTSAPTSPVTIAAPTATEGPTTTEDPTTTEGPTTTDEPPAHEGDRPARPSRRRIWLRRVGTLLIATLLVGLSGLQIQVSRVRTQTERAETAQQIAESDEQTARIRLESVGDRVRIARASEDDAQAQLDASRAAMTAQGFDEGGLHALQVSTAQQVKDLRAGVKKVTKDIAAQDRLRPAAAACLFDMLRALSRVDAGATGGRASEACRTTASSPGPA